MRIATWNVNSMKARLEKIEWWLDRAAPDVLLMQETKLSDTDAPLMTFQMAGYQLVHHGEGRWNGVAIAVRDGIAIDEPITNFGDGPVRDSGAGATVSLEEEDFDPSDEARMVSIRVTAPGGDADPIRVVSLYAPNGRVVDSPFYAGKLRFLDAAAERIRALSGGELVVAGDFNVCPSDLDVYDPAAFVGETHVTPAERERFQALLDAGTVDSFRSLHADEPGFTWWDYRAGHFHKKMGLRIDAILVSPPLAGRLTECGIDRNFRKGPKPSDHAPLLAAFQ